MPTCLITGANRGLGLEFAKQYAADGWKVIATCRRPDTAEALKRIEGDVAVHGLDVTDFTRIAGLAKTLEKVTIDLLILNAGIYGPRVVPYDGVDYAAWAEVFRVNTEAPLKMAAMFTPNVAKGQRKTIVAITSKMGSIAENTSGGSYIYRSTKAALNAVMRSLSHDLRDKGIAVAVLHPGWVRTDMGGSGGQIEAFESVAGMRQVIDGLTMEHSGRFISYDGADIPW